MNLSANYLGLELRSPLVVSASPLSRELDTIKKMEDAGAGAIVLYSLFEENTVACRVNYEFGSLVGPEAYMEQISAAKRSVLTPVIASINCTSLKGWTGFAREIEEAGADGLELNIYSSPTDFGVSGQEIEESYLGIVRAVRASTRMPLALKLSPYFSNLANIAARLDSLGPDALVLFNRFYQSDLDISKRAAAPGVVLSSSVDMRLPLHWISIFHGQLRANLASSGGIQCGSDAIKTIMVGADITMICSVLMRQGIHHLKTIENEMIAWLDEHEIEALDDIRGSMSQIHVAEPDEAYRAQYFRALSVVVAPADQTESGGII